MNHRYPSSQNNKRKDGNCAERLQKFDEKNVFSKIKSANVQYFCTYFSQSVDVMAFCGFFISLFHEGKQAKFVFK